MVISMLKRKGFTLVELLAVIVVLGIVLVVAIPNVLNLINQARINSYNSQMGLIINAAQKYVQIKGSSVSWGADPADPSNPNKKVATVYLKDLQSNNLLPSTMKNPKGGDLDNKMPPDGEGLKVIIKIDNNNYSYNVIDPGEFTVPSAPLNLVATFVSPGVLTWNAPANNGGSPIIGYKIEEKGGVGNFSVVVANTGNTNTTYSDYAVTIGTNTYRVAAINAIGTSDYSNESSFVVACFIAETKITMADGSFKNISDVKIGDKVLSYDGEKLVTDTVTATMAHDDMYDGSYHFKITTEDKVINGVTPSHKIYVKGSDQPKTAYELKVGDILFTDDNKETAITNIEKIYEHATVYNLTIGNNHKYFADGILVSNIKPS